MKRVLFFGMTDNPGGVESFLINYYRHIDREKIQFDFLCDTHAKIAYEDELLTSGGRVFHLTARRHNPIKYAAELNSIFKMYASEWSVIWMNVNILTNIDYLIIAKRFGIDKRIVHSHNSQSIESKTSYREMLHYLNRHIIERYATDFWACSEDAAMWFYTGETLKNAVIIHNAIDVERMAFDPKKREEIRKTHGWEDLYVIGNVGRLQFQKNQSFSLDVFKHYHAEHPNSVLVFVGQGEDEQMLRKKAGALGLSDCVFFAGVQHDIQAWLSSFELFLFPSRFEGLGIAALEAQANGVPVLASKDVIPDEVKINDNFSFFDLDRGAEAWAEEIERMSQMERKAYPEIKNRFELKGFDILKEAEKLERILLA